MPSSTSSSNFPEGFPAARVPEQPWRLCLVVTLLLAVGALASAEGFWRSLGHRPAVVDTPALWAYRRAGIGSEAKPQVVLLGKSRIQLGFSMEEFHRQYPEHQVTQLALNGRAAVATLRDLADDKSFKGLVICSTDAEGLCREHWADQREYVAHYHKRYLPHRAIDAELNLAVQENLVVVHPVVCLTNLSRNLLTRRRLPPPLYIITYRDRSRLADYTMTDIDEAARNAHAEKQELPPTPAPVSAKEWLDDFAEVEKSIAKIQSRGGSVVLLRMPTAPELWEEAELQFPREAYWDAMVRVTSATTVHFLDYAQLYEFDFPDLSHLDERDAPKFTAELLSILKTEGLLP